ncbi:hypothetical protein Btru_065232 [Bulinus truncatus]|nr:hypothetical protein Btru_065232 [Bulinus truncatus]
MGMNHAALLALNIFLIAVTDVASQRCSTFTWLPELGENPLAAHQGKVVLVALMKGYCSYCVNQANKLELLKNRLASEGYPDIAMVIVNGGEPLSRNNIANLQQASSIPVIQDNEQHSMFRVVFRRNKDDFIVFNRCGQRAVIIPHPYSYLGHQVTERVLKRVYEGRHTCYCDLDPVIGNEEQMQADEPQGGAYSVTTDSDMNLQCPDGDRVCRRFQYYNRRNRFTEIDRGNNRVGHRPRRNRGHRRSEGRSGMNRPHSHNNPVGAV